MTQSVANTQELADLRTRALAFIIDFVVIGVLYMIIEILNIPDIPINTKSWLQLDGILYLTTIFTYLCVLPFIFNGSTMGKSLMGIRVTTTDGQPLTIWRLFLRNWPGYLMSFLPLGLGFIVSLKNEKFQTWHDKATNTIVIRTSRRKKHQSGN
jgi:uncharacterized RDD family membrane protein YckC